MIDRNNLNRIKGILSAEEGAEIPKFQNPAQPINKAFYKKDGKYFLDGKEVTQDQYYKDPRVLTESTKIISENPLNTPTVIQTPKVTETVPIKIIGAPVVTPTTAVENAAEQINKIEEQKKDNIADIAAYYDLDTVEVVAPKLKSINDGLKTSPVPVTLPEKLEVPASLLKEQESAGMKFREAKKLEKQERINNITNQAAQIGTEIFKGVGDAFGAKQAATDSNLTKGADAAYDAIASGVEKMGPYGKIIGTAMKFAGTAGDIIQGLGGGTDQMTGTDKWMDSSFFSWNIGMLNGFGGKKTDSFAADRDILASVGCYDGGTTEDIKNAAAKASKKYGLFSSSARRKANRQIADARAKQNLMGDISEEATDQRLAVQSMGEQAGLAYSLMTDGGYNQKYTYAAKKGGLLEWNPVIELKWTPKIELNWELPEYKKGGELPEGLEWVPELQFGNKIRTIEELIEYAKKQNPRFIQRLSEEPRGIKFADDEGNEAEGSHYLEWSTDDSGNAIVYPRIQEIEDGSLKFFPSNEAYKRAISNKNILIMSPEEAEIFFAKDPEYTTAYKKGWPAFFEKFKKGGSLGDSDIPEIEETTQKNVIPEGALHKNKHHMEHAEGLTKKGIPVIDEDGEQQAEIEHSEIIFTLEVTKKLEEYYDIYYSEESSNKEKEQAALDAGKLLVYQILENTEDRTGLIESCKKGGTIQLKKSTDDLIEEVLEWIPTIMVVEEIVEETKEEEPKKKSEKEQMKEAIKEVLIELLTK